MDGRVHLMLTPAAMGPFLYLRGFLIEALLGVGMDCEKFYFSKEVV